MDCPSASLCRVASVGAANFNVRKRLDGFTFCYAMHRGNVHMKFMIGKEVFMIGTLCIVILGKCGIFSLGFRLTRKNSVEAWFTSFHFRRKIELCKNPMKPCEMLRSGPKLTRFLVS